MPISRRNTLVRTITAVCGDVAVGTAVASACLWVIEAAALGFFLSFLLWLVGALLALALSQYLVHTTVNTVLSDRKLDMAVDALASMASTVQWSTVEMQVALRRHALSAISALAKRVRPA